MFLLFRSDSIANHDRIDTILGKDAKLSGEIKTAGLLRIEGTFLGDIECEKDLIITDSAIVEGKIKAKNAIIAGRYKGNVILDGKLEIKSTGKVLGDIKVATLVIEDGAFFDGKCEMNADVKEKNFEFLAKNAKLQTNPT